MHTSGIFLPMVTAEFAPRAIDKMLNAQERPGEHNFIKIVPRQEMKAYPLGRQIRGQDFHLCQQLLQSLLSFFLPHFNPRISLSPSVCPLRVLSLTWLVFCLCFN